MRKTLAEIARIVNGEVVGDSSLVITGLSGIQEAREGDLTFIAGPKYFPLAQTTKASAIITPRGMRVPGKTIIRTDHPSLAFADIAASLVDDKSYRPQGIHPTAVIAKDAVIGPGAAVGAYAVIEGGAVIGERTVIYSGCYVGHQTAVGKDCLFYPHVTLRERVAIGDRVIIHSGTVIGSDGFGFVQVDGVHRKIPQIGTVFVGDDVEIGANVTVDRARFEKTVIGRGTKIDNLVQIAHNVVIGEHCIIISQVGISGSVKIGDGAILAGQVGVHGHLTIGEGVMIASKSGVTKSIPAHAKVSGFPAQPLLKEQRWQASLRRMPVYIQALRDLQQKVKDMEKALKSWPKNKRRSAKN